MSEQERIVQNRAESGPYLPDYEETLAIDWSGEIRYVAAQNSLKPPKESEGEQPLTVVVCSNKPALVLTHATRNLEQLDPCDHMMVILDISDELSISNLAAHLRLRGVHVSICGCTRGLSHARNIAMDLCTTRYVIFIDDDVAITRSTVDAIRGALILGNEIVGVRLLPPPGLPLNKWYISPCQFHYLGLHRNDAPGKTWGACMAFNLDFVRKHALEFRGELGRLRHNLVSGDDTTFILEVKQAGGREQFLDHAHAYHHVSLERLKITSMVYRALWQGRSEVLRENIWQGLWKEWDRNTGGERIGPLGWGLAVLYQSMVTLGVIIELVARLRSLWTNHTYRSMRRQRLKTSATDCAPIAQSTTSQTPVLRLQLLSWLRIILREQRQPTHNSTVWSEIPHDGKEKAVGRD